MLNQISTWFNHDECFGVYTKRRRWLASDKNFFRLCPIVVADDIPFYVSRMISFSGSPPQPATYVQYFREHGVLRSRPLLPRPPE